MAAHCDHSRHKAALPKLTVSSSKPFSFTPQRIDWCTLHGVDLELLVWSHCLPLFLVKQYVPCFNTVYVNPGCSTCAILIRQQADHVPSAGQAKLAWISQAKHCDITALERCLEAGLAHGDLEAEDPSRLTLTNLLRVARMSQMAIQYLLATQDGSASKLSSLQVSLLHATCSTLCCTLSSRTCRRAALPCMSGRKGSSNALVVHGRGQ